MNESIKKHTVKLGIKLKDILVKLGNLSEDAILFVIDENNKLIGSLTDGDIRRTIEKKHNVDRVLASDLMNKNPKVLREKTLAFDALGVMKKNNISQVLVTDPNNLYTGIVHILDIIKQGINDE